MKKVIKWMQITLILLIAAFLFYATRQNSFLIKTISLFLIGAVTGTLLAFVKFLTDL